MTWMMAVDPWMTCVSWMVDPSWTSVGGGVGVVVVVDVGKGGGGGSQTLLVCVPGVVAARLPAVRLGVEAEGRRHHSVSLLPDPQHPPGRGQSLPDFSSGQSCTAHRDGSRSVMERGNGEGVISFSLVIKLIST